MVKPAQSICVSSATMNNLCSTEVVGMERGGGAEGTSWKDMDDDGK